ncbi:MAG: zinc ribbon domain-containing protein, partial [Anaerolineae bacterium]|nr:zinc ribbon domain-containing protein [Anaerolineae bacterium]MCB0240584.1 zinc ribbon domain-containing protein [Anaerolineae bacterium]
MPDYAQVTWQVARRMVAARERRRFWQTALSMNCTAVRQAARCILYHGGNRFMAETSQGGSARFCGQCGAPLLPDAKFCANCGATVQPGAAPAASRTAAAPQAKSNSKLWLALVAAVVLIGLIAVIVLVSQPKPATVSTAAIPTAAVPQDIPYPSVARATPAQAHG